MNLQPQPNPPTPSEVPELLDFAEPPARLELKLSPTSHPALTPPTIATSESLDRGKVDVFPPESARSMEFSLNPIDSSQLDDLDLHAPRMQMGLTFIGFSALGLVFLLIWSYTFHPEFDWKVRVSEYWYPYVGLASLGVAGLIVLAREVIRKQ
jgi:hypothetical protein